MDMDMSIAALSVNMHQAQTSQDMGVAVLKMAMDNTSSTTTELLDDVTESLDTNLGQNLDIIA